LTRTCKNINILDIIEILGLLFLLGLTYLSLLTLNIRGENRKVMKSFFFQKFKNILFRLHITYENCNVIFYEWNIPLGTSSFVGLYFVFKSFVSRFTDEFSACFLFRVQGKQT
jgi:arginine exporter protein ArgO